MSLTVGSVSVDASGNATGNGWALTLYNWTLGFVGAANLSTAQRQGLASYCNSNAPSFINYLTANAVVTTTVPANAFGSGIPATQTTLTGTIS